MSRVATTTPIALLQSSRERVTGMFCGALDGACRPYPTAAVATTGTTQTSATLPHHIGGEGSRRRTSALRHVVVGVPGMPSLRLPQSGGDLTRTFRAERMLQVNYAHCCIKILSPAKIAGLSMMFALISSNIVAQGIFEQTFLLDVNTTSIRSDIVRDLSIGGYELEGGAPVNFADWYTPKFPDLNVLFLSEINSSLAVTWGLSTGEKGKKYKIDPGIWLGFIHRVDLDRHSSVTLSARTLVEGRLKESSCVAFYSIIDSFEEVNCRLAASTLPPADTLTFLVDEVGFIDTSISIRYEIVF